MSTVSFECDVSLTPTAPQENKPSNKSSLSLCQSSCKNEYALEIVQKLFFFDPEIPHQLDSTSTRHHDNNVLAQSDI